MNADDVFWARIVEMPLCEAEQELVGRREALCGELAELQALRSRTHAQGVRMLTIGKTLSLVNERIKYLRKLDDRIRWREVVRDLFGQEAVEQCVVEIERRCGALDDQRRAWAARKG